MKQTPNTVPVTKKELGNEIRSLETRVDIKLDTFNNEIDENARIYRDQILNKLDQVMGELVTIREDQTINNHQTTNLNQQVSDHEKRINALENPHQS